MSTSRRADELSIFGAAPTDWTVDRIRDRLEAIVGGEWGEDPDATDDGVVIPVVRVADIRGMGVATEGLTLRRVRESKLPGRIIGARTLLLEKSGGGETKPVGRAVLTKGLEHAAICSNFMAKTDCGSECAPDFLAYVLDAAYVAGINTAHIQQTTGIQNLRVFDYLNTKVAFPPVPEQQRIADFLHNRSEEIDAALSAKQRQISTLDELRRSSIARAVTRGISPNATYRATGLPSLPEVPSHWRVARVKDVLEFFNTIRVPLSAAERGAMTSRVFDYYGASGVIDKVEDFLFDGSFILLAEDGANLITRTKPLAFLATGKFWVNNHAHILKPRWNGDEMFFVHLLESQDYSFVVTGAAQPKLTLENLGSYRIGVPPEDEQLLIAEYISELEHRLGGLRAQLERQVETLVMLRGSLIHDYVTGKRRVPSTATSQRA